MKPETAASRWHRVRVKASKVLMAVERFVKDAKAQQLAFQHWIEASGKYVWLTYKEVYDNVIKLGNSIRSCGLAEGGCCGIFGANCPEWIISMQEIRCTICQQDAIKRRASASCAFD